MLLYLRFPGQLKVWLERSLIFIVSIVSLLAVIVAVAVVVVVVVVVVDVLMCFNAVTRRGVLSRNTLNKDLIICRNRRVNPIKSNFVLKRLY